MSDEIRTYAQLREEMHQALIAQHPEWIEPDGESPMLDLYGARLADLLAHFETTSDRAAA